MVRSFVRYFGLPTVILLPLLIYGIGSSRHGDPGIWVLGMSALAMAVLIWWERLLPYRKEWQPQRSDLMVDVHYLVWLSVLFHDGLGALVGMLMVKVVGTKSPWATVWPREWPTWLQILVIILTADFMRYWVHRALHRIPLLWRAHAPHHAPVKLYMMNSVRFHWLELSLQYLIYGLPFGLLGVEPRIFGFWALIHVLFGLQQHANIDFRAGPLSRWFMTPEVHRWHHARQGPGGHSNLALATCLWDRLFGTYYCPKGPAPDELGIAGGNPYPQGFLAQMKQPFMSVRGEPEDLKNQRRPGESPATSSR